MKINTFSRFVQNHIDDSIPEWEELGSCIFFSSMAGMGIATLMFLVVAAL